MQKSLLCAALIAALSACDNTSTDNNTQASQQNHNAANNINRVAQAEAVETQFRNLHTYYNQLAESRGILLGQGDTAGFELSVTGYHRGEQNSSAITNVFIRLSPEIMSQYSLNKVVNLKLDTKIDHSDTLAEQGIIAKMVSQPLPNQGVMQRRFLGEENPLESALRYLFKKLRIETVLLANGEIEQHIMIGALELKENNKTLDYDGLDIRTHFKQSDIDNNPNYPFDLNAISGKFILNNSKEGKLLTIEPFEYSGERTADGNTRYKINSLHIRDSRENLSVQIKNLEYRGEELNYDNVLGNFLGKQFHLANGIEFTKNANTFEFNNTTFMTDTRKNDELYDIKIAFETELLKALMGRVKINHMDIKVDLSRFSAPSVNLFQQAGNTNGLTNKIASYETVLKQAANDLAKNGSELLLDAAVDTTAGTATAKGHMKLVGVPADMDFSTLQSDAVVQYVDAALLVRVPEAIPQATGAAAMMEMQAGEFLKKEDGHYVLDFSLKEGKAVLNGKPLPW